MNHDFEQIVSVAIPRPLDGFFSYRISAQLASQVQIGSKVEVPFGSSNKKMIAFVVEKPQRVPKNQIQYTLKDVIRIQPSEFDLSLEIFELCQWASRYYLSPLGELIRYASFPEVGKRTLKKKELGLKIEKDESYSSLELNTDQSSAVNILKNMPACAVALLHGVTGSGKTAVYLELTKKILAQDKNILFLVPEIALTPQLQFFLQKSLKEKIGIWHSAISPHQKSIQYRALAKGELRVLVGARSAVFAPIQNLGLIVVDEEHDPNFKQEERIKYHARDLAIVRAKQNHAQVILGSATPSLESLENVHQNKYFYCSLPKPARALSLSEIHIINLKKENCVSSLQAPLARSTLKKIQQTLDQGEQVMIYLNRRGFASLLLCEDCGQVIYCPDCSISLTFHKKQAKLKCHQCGYTQVIPQICSACHGLHLKLIGAGTESLEAQLPYLLSGALPVRLDRDQISSMSRLQAVLEKFHLGQANLLLGTQMLTKGHDFPNVTLVVVILADMLFHWPDFRSVERAYQILKQLAGRAGRDKKKGRVWIQTYSPQHPVIETLVGKQSEKELMEEERTLRKTLGYPPFGRIARVRVEDRILHEAKQKASQVKQILIKENIEILGPSDAFTKKLKSYYRQDLLLKAKQIQNLHQALYQVRTYFTKHRWRHHIDLDPYGL